MAKLQNEINVKIGDDGLIVLREPTNKEWNDFTADRYPVGRRNKMKDNSGTARAELFDKLVVRIEKIEDNAGPITMETKERIPGRLKAQIIFDALESGNDVDVKN